MFGARIAFAESIEEILNENTEDLIASKDTVDVEGAERLGEADTAMRKGNFAEAYCVLRPLAEAGEPEAQYNIGWMYHNGYGLAVNDDLAQEWWQKSSDQGYTDASFSLAMLYSLGEGRIKKDPQRALEYYLLAMADGHDDAIVIVRSMLLRNDEVIIGLAPEIILNNMQLLGEKSRIRVKKANVRKGAATDFDVVTVLKQEDVIYKIHEKNKWSQIMIPGNDEFYWIFSSLIEPSSSTGSN